jgi:rSAM/selenodomain-associated transferase 2
LLSGYYRWISGSAREFAMISVIIPVLNEAPRIRRMLRELQALQRAGDEIIVVDGGSSDDTAALARGLADSVEIAPRGRALQMNAGAAVARGDILLFLHADTKLPLSAFASIESSLRNSALHWGRFDVRLESRQPLIRAVAFLMNWRSRLTGIVTGDQAIFVRRTTFERIGGYPEIALMEDIALSKALKTESWPVRITVPVRASARKWKSGGVWRTIFLMLRLRLAYFFGADPARLASLYGYTSGTPLPVPGNRTRRND